MSSSRWFVGVALALGAGCGEELELRPAVIPEKTCLRTVEPKTYEVYFVLDVSGSMGPFLTDVKNELFAFASAMPQVTSAGEAVWVEYYLIGFVNDVKVYGGGKMRNVEALSRAFDEAIAEGKTNYNLVEKRFNAEEEENLLDALATIEGFAPKAEGRLVMIATDAGFYEAPRTLSEHIQVRSTYDEILAQLTLMGARVHAFTERELDGLTRSYGTKAPLTSLPGSTFHDLERLRGASDRVRDSLLSIAEEAACN